MKDDRLPSGWVHYAFWAFDHGLARARRGLFGQHAQEATPSSLEESVRVGGADARKMVLRTVVFLVSAYVLLSPVLVVWVWTVEYGFHFGLDEDVLWNIYVAGRSAIGLGTALAYVSFVLKPFRNAMKGLKDARQAVLALESMHADERSTWVGEYRNEARPACSILERRSPVFRSLVGQDAA